MKPNIEHRLELLQKALVDLEQPSLFGDKQAALLKVDALCCTYLEERGYRCIAYPTRANIASIEDLVNYFYDLYNYFKAKNCMLTSNRPQDIGLLSAFVKQRKKDLQCSTYAALQDVASIIEGLFIYEDLFNFPKELGLWVFGTNKTKWITDKIIQKLNVDANKLEERRAFEKAKEWSCKMADSYRGFDL